MTAMTLSLDEARWAALVERRFDTLEPFYYAVVTTGVVCRPDCSSRRPLRENVRFFDALADAEAAGYRPCKRCRPDAHSPLEQQRQAMIAVCRRLETEDPTPTLADLAADLNLSQWHFQRQFRKVLGVTPHQYATEFRAGRLKNALKSAASVTAASYEAGYGSSSRLFEAAQSRLAMSPSEFRRGAPGQRLHYGLAPCHLGWVGLVASERGICGLELADDAEAVLARLRSTFAKAELIAAGDAFDELLAQVVAFLAAPQTEWSLPLDIQGTAFQCQVWQALRTVPVGQTLSYSELATRLGRPEASRAVAGACAANKLAVVVPCHRITRADGDISGYRWGVQRKRRLLDQEAELVDQG
ncbi:bifunctional DNA-binding transcriptional regulator/O6-methylguanine-DNA methyltransferase Ada [Saccharospirillum mangrovi]|uniref:bifunctional DNA-binding transcriptional regulator/O6-methylguanine-DNA methyltransferase Ada n=1 Tax=Saccharospirillum mangrovi TaxID=2161747 RepID=UPI000D345D75|nr:bifunctional DNA-binding transcriptional regulator/O6-methylguanine-DNA methyltransferase Ada [Saccharospirillum mangrovi]